MSCPVALVALAFASSAAGPPRTLDESIAAGAAFLAARQSADGAWRSDVYGAFKDGRALTPLAVVALQAADAAPDARRKAATTLTAPADGDGDLDYPAYTAALSVIALSHPENAARRPTRDAWVKYLLDRQLTAKLGWSEADKPYGGWGYCRTVPRKPGPNELAPPLIESNLSATAFALDALRAAGHTDPATYTAAAVFVRRCRNADGGFHFVYDDPVRNKAGGPPGEPVRFHSYGSATADGLRSLAACGSWLDAAPRLAARDWLTKHFRPDAHPGDYVPAHERNRDAVYYYYAASTAKSLRSEGVTDAGGPWAAALAGELARRQRPDGSWANPVELVRENDPVVATCQALLALAECRAALGTK